MCREFLLFIRRNGIWSVLVHLMEIYGGALLRWLPGPEGIVLRGLFYQALLHRCGKKMMIYPKVYMIFTHRMSVGTRMAINVGTYIDAGGEVEIGDFVMIGPNCVLSSREHSTALTGEPMCFQPVQYRKIVIDNDVWLGAGACIRGGVTLGAGCVVAAGAVVTSDVPPNAIVGGVPARVLRYRDVH